MGNGTPYRVFISYAREDESFRKSLTSHLSMLKSRGFIETWHDREILPGQNWADQIDEHLGSSDIILLLVSADFLASQYCSEIELTYALEMERTGRARVIPVILRSCDWGASRFAHLEALPRDGKPITEHRNRDAAFMEVAQGLRRLLQSFEPKNKPDTSSFILANLPPRDPDFVGRDKLFTRLTEWIEATSCGYLLIVGGVGCGKTAFMTECVHRRTVAGELPVHHFIDYHPSVTGRPEAVAESIYHQLRSKYKVLEPTRLGCESVSDRLEVLVKRDVSRGLGGKKEVIFIDAADQAAVNELEVLLPGTLRLQLPLGVLCVITSRYQLAWLGHPVSMWHWEDVVEQRADMSVYLRRKSATLSAPLDERLIDAIGRQSGSTVFYTAKRNFRILEFEGETPEALKLRSDAALWLVPAEELIEGDALTRIRRLAALGVSEREFWRTLGLLACAGEALSPELMQELRIWKEGTTDLALRMGANFFRSGALPSRPSEPLRFDHPGYQRTIAGDPHDPIRQPGHLSKQDRRWCHGRLADGCWRALVHGVSFDAMGYAARYLAWHLHNAGRSDELIPFLSDFFHLRKITGRVNQHVKASGTEGGWYKKLAGQWLVERCFEVLSPVQFMSSSKLGRLSNHQWEFGILANVMTLSMLEGTELNMDPDKLATCNLCKTSGIIHGLINVEARDLGDQVPVLNYDYSIYRFVQIAIGHTPSGQDFSGVVKEECRLITTRMFIVGPLVLNYKAQCNQLQEPVRHEALQS